jgi:cell division protein FtsB
MCLTFGVGCTPSKYRQQADKDANCLTDEKSALAGIEPASYRIDIDPRSRMFDPNDPDCEPMPPDDPTSNLLMQRVDGMKGSKKWKKLPKTPFVENPAWTDYLPLNERGELVLDLVGAVEMGLMNAPRYQSELEELYLSALDVSFERFRFDAQFFGGSSIFFTSTGERVGNPDLSVPPGNPSSFFEVNAIDPGNRLRMQKFSATGNELVIGLANSLMWEFSGSDEYSSNTLLDFSMIQPLLRGAGRTRVLERLTISERNLLANVREMDRFREAYYVSVVTGQDPGQGPSRRGGVFGGSGLSGFTGVGGGGFGRVGGGFGGFGQGGNGGNFTGGAGAQGAGGYLGLLQNEQVIRNQYANVAALRDSVMQLEASYEAGRIDRFQVDLARQALFNAQSLLLTAETQYQAFLEFFLVNLGLPPELNVKVQDPILEELNLLDPTLERLQGRVSDMLDELRALRDANNELPATGDTEPMVVPGVPATPISEEELVKRLTPILEEVGQIEAIVAERIAAVQTDFSRLTKALPKRRASLSRLASRPELADANIDPGMFSVERLNLRVEKQLADLQNLEARLIKTSTEVTKLVDGAPANRDTLNLLVRSFTELSGQLLELSLVQAGARLEAIAFEPVELSNEQALAIAAVHRQDWMNARANLVDSWRLIYFNANDLRAGLNLRINGDIGNVGDNPFRFRETRGRLRMGLEFDAPLTRLAERNIYRQSLIEFQQARRTYYQFRDGIYQDLRNTLRQIRLNELNFELRRAAVQLAISQVDLTQLRLSEPPQPGETAQFDNTTARDLVQALGDLLNVQNDFLSVWVNYEVQRLSLELDLGVMEVGPNGLRIENNIPFETYLVGLPCNTTDMGLAAEELELIGPALLTQPEALTPAMPLPPAEDVVEPLIPEPLPEPPAEEAEPEVPRGAAAESDILLTGATLLPAIGGVSEVNPLRHPNPAATGVVLPVVWPESNGEFRNPAAPE